ncbi:hypothetical protein CAAN1_14S00584 [[Candida] anglica]|uniref:Uncharacterized protein n=1 Tax=[Candida] anglica TaxID=148631 RepID=A0ABP0EL00_9ASCO
MLRVIGTVSRLRVPSCRTGLVRLYSSNIDDFNKNKKSYSYGLDFNNSKRFEQETHEEGGPLDVNAMLERDPSLQGLHPGTPEYKEQLFNLHEAHEERSRRQQKNQESRERWKAVGLGFGLMISLAGAHQLFMNYEYFTNWLTHERTYKLDQAKIDSVSNLSDPTKNKNNFSNVVGRFTEGLTPEIVDGLKPSDSTPGLYLFGGKGRGKFPLRVPFFDGMLIRDVQLRDDYMAVITEKNELYQLYQGVSQPVKAPKLPYKAVSCQITDDYLYLLGQNGQVFYTPRGDKKVATFEGYSYRNWLGLSRKSQTYGKLNINERVKSLSAGDCHVLLLTESGKLFATATNGSPDHNFGQLGVPKYSPYASPQVSIPINEAFELTGLNNEVVGGKSDRTVSPRVFTHITTGKYHNLVSDISGNVWSWGRNTFGECGTEISYKTDIQSVPSVALPVDNYYSLTKHLLPETKRGVNNWQVEGLYSGAEVSYIKLHYHDATAPATSKTLEQDVLLSFGNGVKGQLGINRYLHVCPTPQVLKSLLNISEFDEKKNKVVNIGVKDVVAGNEHAFVTLATANASDVLCFGDNEYGQLGNGKYVKNAKPSQMPQLIEPEELQGVKDMKKAKKQLTKRLLDVNTRRFQLIEDKKWEQVIAAGENCSAIYYKKK